MAAVYPSNIKNWPTPVQDAVDTVYAAHINDLRDEVMAVETEIGTGLKTSTWSGAFSQGASWGSLSLRLANIERGLISTSDVHTQYAKKAGDTFTGQVHVDSLRIKTNWVWLFDPASGDFSLMRMSPDGTQVESVPLAVDYASGQVLARETQAADPANSVATKGYVDSTVAPSAISIVTPSSGASQPSVEAEKFKYSTQQNGVVLLEGYLNRTTAQGYLIVQLVDPGGMPSPGAERRFTVLDCNNSTGVWSSTYAQVMANGSVMVYLPTAGSHSIYFDSCAYAADLEDTPGL